VLVFEHDALPDFTEFNTPFRGFLNSELVAHLGRPRALLLKHSNGTDFDQVVR
jgi:hypothetical protein